MSMIEQKLLALSLTMLFIVLALGSVYHYGGKAQKVKSDLAAAQLQLAQDKAIADAQASNEALKTELEVSKNESQAIIDKLRGTAVPRVRLPACPETNQAIPAIGDQPAVQTGGILPAGIERILEDDRQRAWQIVADAEDELLQCRVIKEWAKSL